MLEKEKELEAKKENTGQIPETERYSLRLRVNLNNSSHPLKPSQICEKLSRLYFGQRLGASYDLEGRNY